MNYFERSLAIQIYREIYTTTAEHLFMSLPGNGMMLYGYFLENVSYNIHPKLKYEH